MQLNSTHDYVIVACLRGKYDYFVGQQLRYVFRFSEKNFNECLLRVQLHKTNEGKKISNSNEIATGK